MSEFSRREFGTLVGGLLPSAALIEACGVEQYFGDGRINLNARPPANGKTTAQGEHPLGLEKGRDAILQVPAKTGTEPLPLLVLLHGAGSSGERQLHRFGTTPSDAGVAILAPDSRGGTWDAIRGGYGPDVAFLKRALEKVFTMVSVDPARIAIGGFSDGATYALSIGLINGDFFKKVCAFSPGYIISGAAHGKPQFFVSHGRSDDVLPIDQCSRRIVPALQTRGYEVTFREFNGSHEVPPAVVTEGLAWVAKGSA